jgi:hypothetical protein
LLHRHYPASSLLRTSPPPTRPDLALAGCPLRLPPPSPSASRASCVFLRYMPSPTNAARRCPPRRTCGMRLSLASSTALAFSEYRADRRPHHTFRGLFNRSLALRPASSRSRQATLFTEGSDEFVTSPAAPVATGHATPPRQDSHLRNSQAFTAHLYLCIVFVFFGYSRRGGLNSRKISSDF